MPTYYKKRVNKLEVALENIEHSFNKANGTVNVIDIGERAGFRYNRKGLVRKRD